MNDNVVHVNTQTIKAWLRLAVPVPEHIKPGITLRDTSPSS